MITIGLPSRGRLFDGAITLFSGAGFDLSFTHESRRLSETSRDGRVNLALIHPKDAAYLVESGFLDIAVSAHDILAEYGGYTQEHVVLPLSFGHCQIVFAVSDARSEASISEFADCTVATSYPRLTHKWSIAHGMRPNIVALHGAVEVAEALGLADAIVESHETGRTLADNNLKVLSEIMLSQAVLIGTKASCSRKDVQDILRQIVPTYAVGL